MNNERISIIIPTWNNAKTLASVVKSCLNQTLPPLEILICDDGSTDDTKEVIDGINDKRVTWISNNHNGIPAIPRNSGLKKSRGEWIAFCDSDDEWLPTKLEKQIHVLTKSNCKASCTSAFIKKNGLISKNKTSNWTKKSVSFRNLLKNNEVVCSSAIIHSSIFNQIGGFPEEPDYRGFEDYLYWLRVATKTNFAFINEPLVIYDDHPETSIRALFKDGRLLKEKTLRNFIDWAKTNKLHFFVFQTQIALIKEWVKKSLIIIKKSCFKI